MSTQAEYTVTIRGTRKDADEVEYEICSQDHSSLLSFLRFNENWSHDLDRARGSS